MTQEDEELLLKDLCARLHYGVKIKWCDGLHDGCYTLIGINKVCIIGESTDGREPLFVLGEDNVKPYLRPLSSMTEEEEQEYSFLINDGGWGITEDLMIDCIDWLNTHHFDYRGLIKKGLAIEVTKDNNPYKD